MTSNNDIFLGVWNLDASSVPQLSAGVATVTKDENAQVNIHTKMEVGGKMWIDGGIAIINEEGRYKCPKSGGWHDLKVVAVDGNPNKLELTEYGPNGQPIVTTWFKQE